MSTQIPQTTQIPNSNQSPQTQTHASSQVKSKVEKAQNLSLEEKLRMLMSSMRDWERRKVLETANVTIELIKLPAKQTAKSFKPPRLALHIKRSDSFKGIIVDSVEVLEDLIKALSNERTKRIVEALERLNGNNTIELELEL